MAHHSFANGGKIYAGHVSPVSIDVNVPIGGTGAVGTITGAYVTSVTRLAAGLYKVQLDNNYNGYYIGGAQMISPVTGSALMIDASSAALSVGSPYQITTVGNATAAQWAALGVPTGVTPAVGVAFVALATGNGASSTARVKAVAASNIAKVELLANPNLSIAPISPIAPGASLGSVIMIQTLAASIAMGAYTPAGTNSAPALTMNSYTPAGTNDGATPPVFTGTPAVLTGSVAAPVFTGSAASLTGTISYVPADPTSGSVLKLSFLLSNSSVLINGS